MSQQVLAAKVDRDRLREQIQAKYVDVAVHPDKGFHFHTGRPLAEMLGYADEEVDWLPESTVESLAGTGNPFSMGPLAEGETVLDIGSLVGEHKGGSVPKERWRPRTVGEDHACRRAALELLDRALHDADTQVRERAHEVFFHSLRNLVRMRLADEAIARVDGLTIPLSQCSSSTRRGEAALASGVRSDSLTSWTPVRSSQDTCGSCPTDRSRASFLRTPSANSSTAWHEMRPTRLPRLDCLASPNGLVDASWACRQIFDRWLGSTWR
jgi:hypothetical protein